MFGVIEIDIGYGELCGSFQNFILLGDHANSWLTQYYNWRSWFDEILDAEVVTYC
ncbi:hypothetical protein ACFSGI_14025 [Paenibacillus nicotianae]|uniref:Uncharacterized protein n=1 Tax=Paenibacillus nicotianae TaxID=1526551 RepID=A0ABW4UVX3_9BACL